MNSVAFCYKVTVQRITSPKNKCVHDEKISRKRAFLQMDGDAVETFLQRFTTAIGIGIWEGKWRLLFTFV
jgi:hypothetical protein